LFQISWTSLNNYEFTLINRLHIQPSEIDKMEFFRIQYIIDNIINMDNEAEKQRKKEEIEYKKGNEKYQKMFKSNNFSIDKLSKYKY